MSAYRSSFVIFLFCVIANYFIMLGVNASSSFALKLIPIFLITFLVGGISALIVFIKGAIMILKGKSKREDAGWKDSDSKKYAIAWALLGLSIYVVAIYAR